VPEVFKYTVFLFMGKMTKKVDKTLPKIS